MPKGSNSAPGPLTEAVAEILRVERGRRSLTDSAIARLAGVDRIAVGKILKGTKVPDIEVLESIAIALGSTLKDVLRKAEQATEGRRFDS